MKMNGDGAKKAHAPENNFFINQKQRIVPDRGHPTINPCYYIMP
jgi:hypothetical protein